MFFFMVASSFIVSSIILIRLSYAAEHHANRIKELEERIAKLENSEVNDTNEEG
jgi:cell division protein FtsL